MADKIYVGKAKYKTFQNGGELCKIWITPDGLEAINGHMNANGGINLVMSEMKRPDRADNTHTLYIDDYDRQRNDGSSGPARRGHAPHSGSNHAGNDGGFGNDGNNADHRYGRKDESPDPENYAAVKSNSAFSENDIPF